MSQELPLNQLQRRLLNVPEMHFIGNMIRRGEDSVDRRMFLSHVASRVATERPTRGFPAFGRFAPSRLF